MNQWYALYTFREYGSIFYVNALTLRMGTRNMHRSCRQIGTRASATMLLDFTLIMVPCGLYQIIGMAIKPLNKVCSREFWRSASRPFLLLGDLSSHGDYNIWLENGSMLATCYQFTHIVYMASYWDYNYLQRLLRWLFRINYSYWQRVWIFKCRLWENYVTFRHDVKDWFFRRVYAVIDR